MVTRDDVAEAAGTSSAVVSYVVNGGPRPVAPATRARVLAAVAELGYRPNTLARSLRSSSSHTLGAIVGDWHAPSVQLLAGAEAVAAAHDLRLFIAHAESPESTNRHVRAFVDHRADGVLLFTGEVSEAVATELVRAETPAVTIGGQLPEGPFVTLDNYNDLHLRARTHLDGHGCDHMVMVGSFPADAPPAATYDEELSLDEFLDHGSRIAADGIVCATPAIAFAVHAHTRGNHEPTCVLAIAEGPVPEVANRPGLATLHVPWREHGARAVQCLLDILAGDQAAISPSPPQPQLTCHADPAVTPNTIPAGRPGW